MGTEQPFRRGAKGFSAIRLLSAVILACVLGCNGGSPSPGPGASSGEQEAPTSVFKGIEITGRDPDGTRWFLSAESGTAQEAEVTGQLQDVRARFEKGGRIIRLEAGTAHVDRGDEIYLDEGVRMSWSGGYHVEVEEATYRMGEGLLVSESPVEFTAPGLQVDGEGVTVELDGRVVRVGSKVEASLEAVP